MTAAELEKTVYRSAYAGGLLELFVGAALVLMGVGWLGGQVALAAVAPGVLVALWPAVRRRLIEPRSGRARYAPRRRSREHRALVAMLLVGVAVLLLGVVVFWLANQGAPWTSADRLVRGLPAALLGLGAFLAAFVFGLPRLHLYGAILLVAGMIVVAFELEPGWGMLAPGVLLAVVGGILLAGFVRNDPIVPAE